MAYDTLPHFRRLQAALNAQQNVSDGQVRLCDQRLLSGIAVQHASILNHADRLLTKQQRKGLMCSV